MIVVLFPDKKRYKRAEHDWQGPGIFWGTINSGWWHLLKWEDFFYLSCLSGTFYTFCLPSYPSPLPSLKCRPTLFLKKQASHNRSLPANYQQRVIVPQNFHSLQQIDFHEWNNWWFLRLCRCKRPTNYAIKNESYLPGYLSGFWKIFAFRECNPCCFARNKVCLFYSQVAKL